MKVALYCLQGSISRGIRYYIKKYSKFLPASSPPPFPWAFSPLCCMLSWFVPRHVLCLGLFVGWVGVEVVLTGWRSVLRVLHHWCCRGGSSRFYTSSWRSSGSWTSWLNQVVCSTPSGSWLQSNSSCNLWRDWFPFLRLVILQEYYT